MFKRDYKYVLPMYNPKFNSIQFLLPFHINNSVNELPEIVVVLSKNDVTKFYEIMTMLSMEDAYFNARVISMPSCNWLNINKKQHKQGG